MTKKGSVLASCVFASLFALPIGASGQGIVYRCPGPPVTYSDALNPNEAKEKGCRAIDGEDVKPSPSEIAKKLGPNSITICTAPPSPSPNCKNIADSSQRLACFDSENKPSQRRQNSSSSEAQGRKAVLQRLKDPDSAKFGRCTLIKKERMCLAVNARNSLGGYSGEQQAMLHKINNEWILVGIHNIPHADCIVNTVETLP